MAPRDATQPSEPPIEKKRARARPSDTVKADPPRRARREPKPDEGKAVRPAAAAKKKRARAQEAATERMVSSSDAGPATSVGGTILGALRAAEHGHKLVRELVGVAVMAFAGLVLLALLTYHPADPAFTTTGVGKVKNLVGPFGAFLADGLFLLLGLFAHLVPPLTALVGYRAMRGRRLVARRTALGFGLLLIGATCLLQVVVGRDPALPFAPGGLVGVLVARLLVPVVYPLGAFVVATIVTLFGVVIAFERSAVRIVRDGVVFARNAVDELLDRVDAWRLERRLVAEESLRLAAELDLDDDEAGTRPGRPRNSRPPMDAVQEAPARPMLLEDGSELVIRPVVVTPREDAPVDVSALLSARSRRVRGDDPAWTRVALDAIAEHEAGASVLHGDAPMTLGDDVDDGADEDHAASAETPSFAPIIVAPVEGDERELGDATTKKRARRAPPPLPSEGDADDETRALAAALAASETVDTEPGLAPDFKIVDREDQSVEIVDEAPALPPKAAYELPPMKLLDYDAPARAPIDEARMHAEAEKLVRKFKDFGIDGRVREVRPGPVVTTYEFVPAPGIKVSRIAALSDDIAMAMEAMDVRIVAPIPGKGAVGIEIPNEKRETVYLKEIIAHERFKNPDLAPLTMALGKDIEGKPYYADLAAMPHVLISGTTGSGKSVSVNAMICSLLYRCTPDELKFIMIDPKMLELSLYDGIPHLLLPPITDSKKAANALQWAVGEMERRYQAMSEIGVRDLKGFNETIESIRAGTDEQKRKCPTDQKGQPYGKLPFLVIVVDEYADLLAVAGKEVEGFVMRLAQKARAAGIHVMLATQRPSVDVITGVIKANFPVRMGFRLASSHDSKTIINRPGAEKLLGRGDMLIMPPGTSNVTRVHGAFISEKELHRVVEFMKQQVTPDYDMSILDTPAAEGGADGDGAPMEKDAKYEDALEVVRRSRKCSTSWLQRQLGIGYNRAARIVEMMEREGLVGPQINAKGDREIFLAPSG